MPSTYTEHADKWKSLSEIDYFTHFIKAWIPFNAWYSTFFPTLKTDREAINEIKNNSNTVKSRFLGLLNGMSEESAIFRQNIAQLHYCLSNTVIQNNDQRIYFESFVIELDRSCLTQQETHKTINYYVNLRVSAGEITNVQATVSNSSRTNLLNYNHTSYDIQHLRADRNFIKLSTAQKSFLEQLYNTANPKKPVSFLTSSQTDCIEIGQFRFINDPSLIFKGVIEIIYGLRNVLFHGQIIPNKDTNAVYEPAYKILKMIVDGL